jgi:hypothetical protein
MSTVRDETLPVGSSVRVAPSVHLVRSLFSKEPTVFNVISLSDLSNVLGGHNCPTCGQPIPGGGQQQQQQQPGGEQGDPGGGQAQQAPQAEQILQAIVSLIGQYMQARGGGQGPQQQQA